MATKSKHFEEFKRLFVLEEQSDTELRAEIVAWQSFKEEVGQEAAVAAYWQWINSRPFPGAEFIGTDPDGQI